MQSIRKKHDYRGDARVALGRAKNEISYADPGRLRYAALELRLAMEALTYDRLQAFAAEIPPSEYATWQPKRVMDMLLAVDPHADQHSTLRYGIQDAPGVAAESLHILGSEYVLNLKTLKQHYDALGSFLHMPTLKQLESAQALDEAALRLRCEAIVKELEAALASRVHNVTLGMFAQLDCVECGKPIRRRIPSSVPELDVECFHCGVGYRLEVLGGNKVDWQPQQQEVTCPKPACGRIFALWNSQVKLGTWWTCEGCGSKFEIGYAILDKKDLSEDKPDTKT